MPFDRLAHGPRVAREDKGGEVDVARIELEQWAGRGIGLCGGGLPVAAALGARDLARRDVPARGSERRSADHSAAREQPSPCEAVLAGHPIRFRELPMIASCMYSESRCKGKRTIVTSPC